MTMKLIVNGRASDSEADTVRDLITELDLTGRAVAVEVNKTLVPRREHETTKLSDGDVIEIVTLVGGG